MVTGRYRLAESIGQGGMGRVWRATDEMLDRQVAVKEMRIDGLDPEDTRTRRERTLREARATARIDHPNVVRIYDVVDQGERLWIVMELVAGRSLEQLVVEDGPLDPPAAARIGLELVAALRQVHAGGVLHRDIKPGNVLVERRGHRVVLTDFGIAALQDAEALTMVGMLVGSPDYMAPERVSGRPQGPPSDVWSLGATLCAALGGRSPFSRSTTLATLHAVLYEEPELPSTAGELGEILAALLEKEPSTRPGLAELETALRPIAFPRSEETESSETGLVPEPAAESPESPEAAETREPSEPSEAREIPEASEASETSGASEASEASEVGGTAEAPDAPGMPETPEPAPPPVPPFHQESPTRALLDVSLIRAAQHLPPQRAPEPTPEPASEPDPVQGRHPGARPHTRPHTRSNPRPLTPTRAPPEPTPTPEPAPEPSAPLPLPRTPSLATHTTVSRVVVMPPGELPGPAVPSVPRRGRRRMGLAAAGGVVIVGTVVGLVMTQTGGSSHDTTGASTSTSTSTSPSASSTSPNSAQTSSTSTTDPSSPPPTVDGTSRPPSLPAGARKEAGLYAWVPPQGWQRVAQSGSEVHYTSPDRAQEIVANATPARGDLLAQWQQAEVGTSKGLNYHRIRLERTTFRGAPAVVWEYTVTARGRLWHVRLLGFRSGGTSYEISTWYHPDIEATALPVYDAVKKSFTPL
ncbi:protein kinase [Streptomyces sp. S1D4-23]|uniref:serine/threonine-protein kinase n=1 Tax=Streptomyces sp. S1D4-23 TaxID=2594463 RepID=UPI0011622262|nr:protein kinase [Streptomyces sp. S1D4-23]QDO08586.1 protein kinase [Streptomyces sp. S1D4-23]